ncbi:MAG TPA: V-type ATPase 116kDa subunit family protein [Candidatus Bathyarchaeia archaeon]|nr:V-type ATPase 116kDa subunit family protein [Candidatus Bathyarchaeia archaeon]
MALQKMAKIQIIGPKNDLHSTVDFLYNLGTVHLEDASKTIAPGDTMLRRVLAGPKADVAGALLKVSGMYHMLPTVPVDEAQKAQLHEELRWKNDDQVVEEANQVISELETITKELATRKSDIEFTLTNLAHYKEVIEKLQPLEAQLPILEGFEVTVILIQREFKDVLEIIRAALVEITHNQFELMSADVDEETTAAVTVFNKRYSNQVHSFVWSQNVNEVRLPPEYLGKPFNQVLTLVEEQSKSAAVEMNTVNDDLAELSSHWYPKLAVLKEVLEDRNEELNVFTKFGQTDYTFVMVGWVPKKQLENTKNALKEAFKGRVIVNDLEVSREERNNAPSSYDNPRLVKPFEALSNLIGTPRYSEIEPTLLLALFFPFFFGLMVGDIGYGLCILAFALAMRWYFGRRSNTIKQLMNILIICSIPTFFFGYLFGEFFGNLGQMMGWLQPVTIAGTTLNRLNIIVPMIIFTVAIGVFHVFFGLSLGVVNARRHSNQKLFCTRVGMMLALAGIIVLLLAIVAVVPSVLATPGVVLLVIAIPLIVYGGGIAGAIEVMSTFTNVLSYARLMALGMASVVLALVANELGSSLGIVLIGFLIAVLLHGINVVLCMFSPSLQALRLHIVEFYSKFYEGGGRQYTPFKRGTAK